MAKKESKTQRSYFTPMIFLFLLWGALIVFVRSESFVRWFDDPKEVVFYSGLLGLFLWQRGALQKKLCEMSAISLVALLALVFLFYLPINIFFTHPPINEALAVVGKYALFVGGVAALSQRSLDFNLKWMRGFCLILIPAVLCSFYFIRADYFIEPLGYAPYYVDTLTLILPLTLYFAFHSPKPWLKIILSFSILVFLFGIMMTARKSGFVVLCFDFFALIFLAPFFFKGKIRRNILMIGIGFLLLAGSIFLISQNHLPAFGGVGAENLMARVKFFWNESDNSRLNLIQRSWEGLMQSPLWGWGYGSFRFMYLRFFQNGDPNSGYFAPHNSRWVMHPHNETLYQLFEGGFVGGVLLGLVFLVLVGLLIKKIKKDDRDKKILTLTVLFGLLNVFVIGLVNTSLTHPLIRFELLMYVVLAVLLVRDDLPHLPIPRFLDVGWWRRSTAIFLTFLILSSGGIALSYCTASYFIKKSEIEMAELGTTNSLEWAAVLMPRSYDYLVRDAGYALRQGELQRARDLWATAYHEFPYLPQTILEYAKVLMRLGDIDQARILLQKGHELYSFYEPLEKFYQKTVKRIEEN